MVNPNLRTDPSTIYNLLKSYALSPSTILKAHHLFQQIHRPTLPFWNLMIQGWSLSDQPTEAIRMYNLMYRQGLLGNNLTYPFSSRPVLESLMLLAKVFVEMPETDLVSWNSLICGYCQCKRSRDVLGVFDAMRVAGVKDDVVTMVKVVLACTSLGEWGYSQAGQFTEAVRLFKVMMEAKVKPDEITVASVLSACAHIDSLDVGEAVHDYIRKYDVKADIYVGNALIDIYCKCGVVEKALEVFKEMRKKDSVMDFDHFRPCTCAHAGLVDKGLEYYESMEKVYGLKPEMKHYGCVADLLSRSGNLQRAFEFIKEMPVTPDVVVWRILLSASQVHGNISLAEIATKKLLELDSSNSGKYVLSSNTYAGSNRREDAIKMRELMEQSNVQKPSDGIAKWALV
ncbi:Pentatricopeptide repeat-containing protein [Glycine soja]|uniref:Pentatricopeptide repeat-containing protein n=1 Tax=Glycine soja TaxID=3848 RepID=A0A0B2NQR9_GLYSO|nr:Pentatricopeptide repeat-containing protein [Glycine soja]